jgi:hypothetical protein
METYDAIPIKNLVDVNKARKDLETLIGRYADCHLLSSEKKDVDVFGSYGPNGALIILQSFNTSKAYEGQNNSTPFYRLYFSGVPTAQFVHELAMIQEKYK